MNWILTIILNIFIPKKLKFGQDIKKIVFNENSVDKYFKDFEKYNKTIEFNEKIGINRYFPKIYDKSEYELRINVENCGDLLSLYNIPHDWEIQLNNIRNIFIKNGIYILDLRFLPFTPFVLNNICVKNNKIYIVDQTMWFPRSEKYINFRIEYLKFQIKFYLFFKNYVVLLLFLVHIPMEIIRMIVELLMDVIL
jgi:hypothetical protein